jgi:hypothetical protein
MKTFEITLESYATYTIKAETEEEAIMQAIDWFNECEPEIFCEEIEEVS